MANKIIRLLQIHGYKLNDVQIKSINQDSVNIITNEGVEYILRGNDKILVEKEEKTEKVKKPRGWHLKAEYVDSEGNVYHYGVEKPELKRK